jgi:hypothetical protein
MTVLDPTDARAAGELIRHALTRAARPVEGSDYRALLDKYRTDLRFKDTVDTFAGGLGLSVLGTPRSGMVLAPDRDTPFAVRLADLKITDADSKLIFGLILLAAAAYAYPNEVDLDDPDAKVVDVVKLDEFIRTAIAGLRADADAGTRDGMARTAAEVYVDLPSFTPTQTGRRAAGCTLRSVETVCGWLVEQGAAREAKALGPDAYQLTDRFRLLVADSAGSDTLDVLRAARRAEVTARPQPRAAPRCGK